jgi:hypothetical protein
MAALKGAFLQFGAKLLGALPSIVVFQFNPAQVSRTPSLVTPPQSPDNSGKVDSLQQPSQPSETLSFTLRVDATEQLAAGNPIARINGVLPVLSALELLMLPQSSSINLFGSGSGPFQFPPAKLSTVLFFWGTFRILPVAITSMNVTETEYDTILNPIRADVSINLSVLQPAQLAGDTLAQGAYSFSQNIKQVMAALNTATSAQIGVSSALPFSF